MSIIESIRTFIYSCPLVNGNYLNVDFLQDEPTAYSIDGSPTSIIEKKYVDGGSIRKYQFAFASREAYTSDIIEQIANSSFFEDFTNWLEEQTNSGNLPVLGEGKTAIEIKALSTGYLYQATANTARYQVQCELRYKQI